MARIDPGETVLTRMPCGTNSSAQRSVSKISAALAAPYWPDIVSCGDQPEIDATLMTGAPGRSLHAWQRQPHHSHGPDEVPFQRAAPVVIAAIGNARAAATAAD